MESLKTVPALILLAKRNLSEGGNEKCILETLFKINQCSQKKDEMLEGKLHADEQRVEKKYRLA